jgi:hypothetical protein
MARISYVPVEQIPDPELAGYLRHAAQHGTPRPEIQAIRAHAPEVMRTSTRTWNTAFQQGEVDHAVKELCRVYVSKTLECHY